MQKIQMPLGMFSVGSVIQIEFAYEDKPTKSKRRPAIVIDFDNDNTRVMVLKVTTKGIRTQYDYEITDYDMANLKAGSVVRCNHTLTLPNNYKCEKHSNLSRRDYLAVNILYNQAIQNNSLQEINN